MTVYVDSMDAVPGLELEVVSPELVLVDPVLAAEARLAMRERAPHVQVAAARRSDASVDAAVRRLAVAVDGKERDDRGAPPGQSWRTLAAVAAVTVLAVVLLDVHVEVGRTPATAESTHGTRPVHAAPKARLPGHPSSSGTASARRFAWAPVEGADAYRVELFRGAERVFSTIVTRSQLTVPASWTFDAERRSLAPGQYKWYVWAIVAGKQVTTAVVQANLVVS